MKFTNGEECYIVENGLHIVHGRIIKWSSGRFIIKLDTGKKAFLPESRLYKSKEEAAKNVTSIIISDSQPVAPKKKSLYDYWH